MDEHKLEAITVVLMYHSDGGVETMVTPWGPRSAVLALAALAGAMSKATDDLTKTLGSQVGIIVAAKTGLRSADVEQVEAPTVATLSLPEPEVIPADKGAA